MNSVLIIAGEASGDLHGGPLLQSLKQRYPNLRFVGVGGVKMLPWIDKSLGDITTLGVVGYWEVLKKIPQMFQLRKKIISCIQEENIQHVIFIDYPGFNLRLATTLRKLFPYLGLHHYICPQVWAWKPRRIPTIGNLLDTLYCLFPFEAALFDAYKVNTQWVGHPLVDWVQPEVSRKVFCDHMGWPEDQKFITLLPGSRPDEIRRLLPVMLEAFDQWHATHPHDQWLLVLANTISLSDVETFIQARPIKIVTQYTYAARAYAHAAIVSSGTATLETAMLGIPMLAIYKLHPVTYFMAKQYVTLPYFSLANVVLGEKVIPELIQSEVTSDRLIAFLKTPDHKQALEVRRRIYDALGPSGAIERVVNHLGPRIT